jgi:hypothetical protein
VRLSVRPPYAERPKPMSPSSRESSSTRATRTMPRGRQSATTESKLGVESCETIGQEARAWYRLESRLHRWCAHQVARPVGWSRRCPHPPTVLATSSNGARMAVCALHHRVLARVRDNWAFMSLRHDGPVSANGVKPSPTSVPDRRCRRRPSGCAGMSTAATGSSSSAQTDSTCSGQGGQSPAECYAGGTSAEARR